MRSSPPDRAFSDRLFISGVVFGERHYEGQEPRTVGRYWHVIRKAAMVKLGLSSRDHILVTRMLSVRRLR